MLLLRTDVGTVLVLLAGLLSSKNLPHSVENLVGRVQPALLLYSKIVPGTSKYLLQQ